MHSSDGDLLASMRAHVSTPSHGNGKLAENVPLFGGPGGALTVLNGPTVKFMW